MRLPQQLPWLRHGWPVIALSEVLCTQMSAAATICVLLLPLDWFMPLETTLFHEDSLSVFLAVPLSYSGMLGRTFPLHRHCLACVSHALNLLSVLLKSLNQKYFLPPGSSQNQCIVQGEKNPNPCRAMVFLSGA